AEIGTITHSCANAWRAKFADLEIALRGNRTRSGAKSERVTGANLRLHLCLGLRLFNLHRHDPKVLARRDRIELDCQLTGCRFVWRLDGAEADSWGLAEDTNTPHSLLAEDP